MADSSAGTMSAVVADVPEYPMSRSAGCPLVRPPEVLALNEIGPLTRVSIWDGSTPWLITGYQALRALLSDSRASVDDCRAGTRFRRMLSKHSLLRRMPTLRLAVPFQEQPLKHDAPAYGLYELPVTG
jgi:hypothetical protein